MLTCDTLFNGKLLIYQEKDGYRFSLDAILLACLSSVRVRDRVIDLGVGCGIVPLILAYRSLGQSITGVEIQEELASLARRNVDRNGFSDLIQIVHLDLLNISAHVAPETFDIVLSNPPYRKALTGRINPSRQRAIARHEGTASVADVFVAGRYLLPSGGRLGVIFPASRLDHLMWLAHEHGFSAKHLTIIYSKPGSPARLVYLECRKDGGEELYITPPFFIYDEDGSYSQAMLRFYDG